MARARLVALAEDGEDDEPDPFETSNGEDETQSNPLTESATEEDEAQPSWRSGARPAVHTTTSGSPRNTANSPHGVAPEPLITALSQPVTSQAFFRACVCLFLALAKQAGRRLTR